MADKRLWLACLPVLMGTTAASAQDVSLGFTLGPSVFLLPEMSTGVISSGDGDFDGVLNGIGIGGTLGASAAFALGELGGLNAAIGVSGFASFARLNSTAVDSFTGPGVVVIPGTTTPGSSSIALTTASDGVNSSGNSTVNDPLNPQGGTSVTAINVVPGPGISNVAAVTPSGGFDSFTYAGVVTDGAGGSAAAYGAIGATDGGIFIGAGDLSGLTVTTTLAHDIAYLGADMTLALSGAPSGTLSLQGYAGPSYRFIGQRAATSVSVDIPEIEPTAVIFPTYRMDRVEDFSSHYLGGVVGFNASSAVSDTAVFNFGAEAGVYHANHALSGTESYTVEGGANTLNPYAAQTVFNDNGPSGSAAGLAWAGRLNGSLTMTIAPNRQITVGGSADYLSSVATVTRSSSVALAANTYSPGSDDGTLLYNAPSGGNTVLSFGDMLNFTGTISLTGQF